MIRPLLVAIASLLYTSAAHAGPGETGPGVPAFWVRPGHRVTVAADDLGEARFIDFGHRGTLFLSQPGAGKILALVDADGDGRYEKRTDFVADKPTAHGLHFVDGWLWFTTSGAVFKSRDTNGDGVADETITVVDGLPEGGGHWYRSICVDADGFFTSIGDSSNTGDEEAEQTDRQKIWRFSLDGKTKRLWSSGLRNTEKLRLRPGTKELWGADHGSDWFGRGYGENKASGEGLSRQAITDAMPPEEFNRYDDGAFYGHPWIVGDRIPRPEFKDRADLATLAARTVAPMYAGGAHWANNGWTFATKDAIGPAGDAYIAYHGSWNSSRPVGYRVQRVCFDPETGTPYGGLPIVRCIAEDGRRVLGRPCDVAEAPDGSLLFTCSQTKRIYRIAKAN